MTLVGVGHALADAFAFVGEDVPKTLGLHPGTFSQVPLHRMRAILASLRHRNLMAGGSAANTVKLAARLGVDTHFVGQCGHDEPGQVFESELLGAGVKVNLSRSDEPTGLCVTFLTPNEAPTVATHRSASGDLRPGLVSNTLVRAATVVVAEGYLLDEPEFFRTLLNQCRALGKPLALDTGDGTVVEGHQEELLGHLESGQVGYLFLGESDAATLTGLEGREALARLAALVPVVVLKRGTDGWLAASEGQVIEVASSGVQAVDPTGTGDGFQAGFLWGRGRGLDLKACCQAGALVADCVAEQPGTRVDPVRWQGLVDSLARL